MKVQRTVRLTLEIIGNGEGVMTLLDERGEALESLYTTFWGDKTSLLGQTVKTLLAKAENLHG